MLKCFILTMAQLYEGEYCTLS